MKLEDIQKAISKGEKHWEAEDNPIHRLSDEEKKYRGGFVPKPGTPSLQEREKQAKAKTAEAMEAAALKSFDWRRAGGDWITPIKDQGNCGSCIAFGTIATAEALTRISKNNRELAVDYSEADLFYCGAEKQDNRTCVNGWWLEGSHSYFQSNGVVDDACFPYTPGDQACNLCADSQNRKTRISGARFFTDTKMMKDWISTRSPLTTTFTIYEDFFAYKSGVYYPTTDKVVTGHSVSVVGYEDNLQPIPYWICKNSWGPNWGEKGFFRIQQGQCGIDHEMWAIDGI